MAAVTICSDFEAQENEIYHYFHFFPIILPQSDVIRGFPGRESLPGSWQRICLPWRRPLFDFWVGKIPWRRDRLSYPVFLGFSGGSDGKESSCKFRTPGFNPQFGKISWRRACQPTLVLLPGESSWTEEPGGLQSMRSQTAGHDE